MHSISLWETDTTLPSYDALHGDLHTDVLIIGGGMCGLLCAYFLTQAGIDCTVVESRRIASGTTGCTTAKITSLHGCVYRNILAKSGQNTAQGYFLANEQALAAYAAIAADADCNFTYTDAYTYSLSNPHILEQEYNALQHIGAHAVWHDRTALPFSTAGAVGLCHQAQFHPLKCIEHIIRPLRIYEHTRIIDVTPHYALYDGGTIHAKAYIVATHFPFIKRYGLYPLKLYQHRSYMLALEHTSPLNGMYVDEAEGGLSFRQHGEMLLLGGGGARTGKPCGNWNTLLACQKTYFPHSTVRCQWATQDCMSLDNMPLIGQYSPRTPHLFVATGFNKWGMTSSMVAAKILTDTIRGIPNAYADIFAPSRSILHPQLAVNGWESLSHWLYPSTKRCPHLGCALRWNPQEHSWDCPCHGSRFAEDGTLLNNPATKDADGV